jgi:hypothetical protein
MASREKKAEVAPKSKKVDHECEQCGAVGKQGMHGIGSCQICGHRNSYAPKPSGKEWTFTSCGCVVVILAVIGVIIYAILEPAPTKEERMKRLEDRWHTMTPEEKGNAIGHEYFRQD